MKVLAICLISLAVPVSAYPEIFMEAPPGSAVHRYEVCDEHHECQAMDISQKGKASDALPSIVESKAYQQFKKRPISNLSKNLRHSPRETAKRA